MPGDRIQVALGRPPSAKIAENERPEAIGGLFTSPFVMLADAMSDTNSVTRAGP
jgi:hypothetical protein